MKKKIKYTPKQLDFLRRGYLRMTASALAVVFNEKFGACKTAIAIKSALSNHGIVCGRRHGKRFTSARLYSPQEIKFLENKYPGRNIEDLRQLFNKKFHRDMTWQQIRIAVHSRGFVNGRDGRFQIGHKPWNMGTKGLVKPNSGNFRKGQTPVNTRPLGAERITKDGFTEIKIRERNPYTGAATRYKHKHVHIYEQLHGRVPEGCCVFFRDGDRFNFEPGNLVLISRAELVRLNQANYKEVPAELKPSVLALAKLTTKIGVMLRPVNEQPVNVSVLRDRNGQRTRTTYTDKEAR